MRVEVTQDKSKVTMTIVGRIDTLSAPEFDSIIEPYLSLEDLNLVVDISQVDYVSSSGLRSFIKLLKQINVIGGRMTIVGMTPPVKEIFDMTGFSTLFMMLPALDDSDPAGSFHYYLVGKKI